MKSLVILKFNKKEKILFILSKYYKIENNVIKEIYKKDAEFAKKLENYVF
jgi:hypothetical protein